MSNGRRLELVVDNRPQSLGRTLTSGDYPLQHGTGMQRHAVPACQLPVSDQSERKNKIRFCLF